MPTSLEQLRTKKTELLALLTSCITQERVLREEIAELDRRIGAQATLEQLFLPATPEQELITNLYLLRVKLSGEFGKGPYGIFNDETLAAIAEQKPENEVALHRINGMSAERVEKYGDRIVGCVLATIKPDAPLPTRPYFLKCPNCTKLQILVNEPKGRFRCKACANSKDPRSKRPQITYRLPTAKEFD